MRQPGQHHFLIPASFFLFAVLQQGVGKSAVAVGFGQMALEHRLAIRSQHKGQAGGLKLLVDQIHQQMAGGADLLFDPAAKLLAPLLGGIEALGALGDAALLPLVGGEAVAGQKEQAAIEHQVCTCCLMS